jgi:FAD/FMN-containing dehydrogenase
VKYGVTSDFVLFFGHAGDGNLHPTVIFDDSDAQSRDRYRTFRLRAARCGPSVVENSTNNR